MLYIKTFALASSSDDDINKFLETIDLIENGILVTQNGIMLIRYLKKDRPKVTEKSEFDEQLTKEYRLNHLKEVLAGKQSERIQASINLFMANFIVKRKSGSTATHEKHLAHAVKCEHDLDALDFEIITYKKIIEDLEKFGLNEKGDINDPEYEAKTGVDLEKDARGVLASVPKETAIAVANMLADAKISAENLSGGTHRPETA